MKNNLVKNIITLLMICILAGAMASNIYANEQVELGDVNEDGKLSVRDALVVLKAAAKLENLDGTKLVVGDVNPDGVIDSNDAILILKKSVGLIWYFPNETVVASGKVYIAGDSIASEHDPDENYERQVVGWGVVIGELFSEEVTVINEARSGRSSKTYIRESNYPTYIGNLAKGDYYLISFGHNDEKRSDPSRYTDPTGASDERESFKWYLKTYYIDPAVEVGAYPILISSVVRHSFTGDILNQQSHTAYAIAMEELVEEYKAQGINVGYIDLHQMTADCYNEIGSEEAMSLHAYTATGLDGTHYCEKGARIISQMIVSEMEKQKLDISKYIKSDTEGANYE